MNSSTTFLYVLHHLLHLHLEDDNEDDIEADERSDDDKKVEKMGRMTFW